MGKNTELDAHHRATIEKIFNHPVGHNIQWHDVLSLLRSVATVTEEAGGRYTVTLGSETETVDSPRHHDLDAQQVVDLRRMLRTAGISPRATPRPDPRSDLRPDPLPDHEESPGS
ncbi:MAG TPA: hypothetical protein VND62_10475 [Acidimicrobiales bacterium]|nr:hypothetical protein [Acidimicrobiales bacterium]